MNVLLPYRKQALGRNRHRVTAGERTYSVLTDQQVRSRECQAVMNGGQQWPERVCLKPSGNSRRRSVRPVSPAFARASRLGTSNDASQNATARPIEFVIHESHDEVG
jgi:hypothetical protein